MRLQDTTFKPNTMTFVQTGVGPVKLLKKAKAITYYTGVIAEKLQEADLTWRRAELEAFDASHRLIVDCPEQEGLQVQGVLSALAVNSSGEDSVNACRSFADTAADKRNVVHVSFSSKLQEAALENFRIALET